MRGNVTQCLVHRFLSLLSVSLKNWSQLAGDRSTDLLACYESESQAWTSSAQTHCGWEYRPIYPPGDWICFRDPYK